VPVSVTHDKLRELPNMQRVYKWDFFIPKLPPGLRLKGMDSLNERVETTTLPNRVNQVIEIMLKGFKVKQAGIPDYGGPLPLTFIEDEDGSFIKFIKDWENLQSEDGTGKQAPKKDVVADAEIWLLNSNLERTHGFKMLSAQPEDMAPGDLSGDTSDVLKPSLSLGFDYFRHITA